MDTINLLEYTLWFYLLTVWVSILINQKSWKKLIKSLSKDKVFIKIAGAVSLGLWLICVFAISSLESKLLLQVVVWMMVAKWVLALIMTPKMCKKMTDPFISSNRYLQLSAVVSIILWIYFIVL